MLETVCIDIDSTLYDFEGAAREAFLKLFDESGDREYLKGAYNPWNEWRSPADACGLDAWLKVIDMCHEPEVILAQTPYQGSVETVRSLDQSGYGLIYLSARAERAVEATTEWLGNSGFPMEGHQLVCTFEDKLPLISHCRYLIDDRPKTIIEFLYDVGWDVSAGERKALSLLHPYNRCLSDIPNLFLSPSWAGIASYLSRKGILSS